MLGVTITLMKTNEAAAAAALNREREFMQIVHAYLLPTHTGANETVFI